MKLPLNCNVVYHFRFCRSTIFLIKISIFLSTKKNHKAQFQHNCKNCPKVTGKVRNNRLVKRQLLKSQHLDAHPRTPRPANMCAPFRASPLHVAENCFCWLMKFRLRRERNFQRRKRKFPTLEMKISYVGFRFFLRWFSIIPNDCAKCGSSACRS